MWAGGLRYSCPHLRTAVSAVLHRTAWRTRLMPPRSRSPVRSPVARTGAGSTTSGTAGHMTCNDEETHDSGGRADRRVHCACSARCAVSEPCGACAIEQYRNACVRIVALLQSTLEVLLHADLIPGSPDAALSPPTRPPG